MRSRSSCNRFNDNPNTKTTWSIRKKMSQMLRNATLTHRARPLPCRFLVGPSRNGRWIVADRMGLVGGLFTNREAALHFVKVESADVAPIDISVAEVSRLELADLFSPAEELRGRRQ